ncbi:hybrid sensor histidine kinase/response regulator [Thiorhodococcus minor]|uniref:Sensory/regulatory protein RpfC n=1 Tax=Thiorhodococcus minor TaxID=57489 RepID=A0A6M0K4N5_9GAMM|nr:response regulator [Thiorhodococcus minor]NEV64746.1 response regulator [Thiorhodococcus minor]
MPAHRPGPSRFGLQWKLALVFFGLALLVSAGTSLVLYQVARDQVRADLRQRLGDIVGVAAASLDAELHVGITPELGMDSDPFRRMRKDLQAVRDSASDLKYVYSLRRGEDGTIRFVVDAEEDPEDAVDLDVVYEDASPLLQARFPTLDEVVVEQDFYTDQWGTFLSGYAPIRLADGTRVGVLGADITATTVRAYEQRVLRIAVGLFLATLPPILLGGWWMGRAIAKPIVRLNRGALRIAEGDLGVRLGIDRRDEIGALAASFDHMAGELAEGRQKIEEVARKYRAIFDNAAEGIFQTTADGKVITANRACQRMLGVADLDEGIQQIQDLGTQVYTDPEDRSRLLADVREHGTVTGFETRLKRPDGSTFWGEISLHRVKNAEGGDILEGMLLDVTDRRRRQEAEREREAAKAASEAKSGFLANMSHEIRTPLNAVMGLTDLALRTDLDERQRDYLVKVKASARSLLGLINDILDFSKIEAGRLDLEQTPFSLDEVLASLTEMFAYRAHERDVELIVSAEPDVPRALIGDPLRLGQILINLAGNAIKFTEHGEVAVLVSLCQAADRDPGDGAVMLCLEVRDTGPGIPLDRLETIFQSFAQADGSITRRHGGTGLGLAITRELVGMMGGDIRVESRVGEGSRFIARVLMRRQAAVAEASPSTPVDLRGLRVLVVDDNATSREILISQIQSFQMQATAAASGEEALRILADAEQSFDLVLMDWKMPGLNGLETTRRIRTRFDLAKTPVVCMISAYAREDLMQPGERSILDAFLHKPVNQSFLFDTIMGLFGHEDAAVTSGLLRAEETAPEAPDLRGSRVLLVEDIEVNRQVAVEWLTSVGLEVDTAENGAQALTLADPDRHAAVLMDLQMPVMDGLEATRRIRAALDRQRLPIIAMTAHALKGDLERCLAAGMNDYVAKPIDPARLFAVLARWIPAARPESKIAPEPAPKPPRKADAAAVLIDGLELPGLDLSEGLARANRNAGLYLKMLRGFRASWADTAERIEQALAASHADEARRLAHSLKSVAGNLGAKALYDAALAVEDAVGAGRLPIDDDIWRVFSSALAEVAEGLRALPTESAEAGQAEASSADVADLDLTQIADEITDMIRLLDDDLDQGRARLIDLAPQLKACVDPARIATIQRQIDDFDIDAAIASLETLCIELTADDRA